MCYLRVYEGYKYIKKQKTYKKFSLKYILYVFSIIWRGRREYYPQSLLLVGKFYYF